MAVDLDSSLTVDIAATVHVLCTRNDGTLATCTRYPGEAHDFTLVQAPNGPDSGVTVEAPRVIETSCDAATGAFRIDFIPLSPGVPTTVGVHYRGNLTASGMQTTSILGLRWGTGSCHPAIAGDDITPVKWR